MKILLRSLIILVAAALVVVATSAALQAPGVQSLLTSRGEHGARLLPELSFGAQPGGRGFAPGAGNALPAPASTAGVAAQAGGGNAPASSSGAQASGAQASGAQASGAPVAGAQAAGAPAAGARPQLGEGGRGGGRNAINLAGWPTVAQNLVIVVVLALAVAAVGYVVSRLRPRRRSLDAPSLP